ncbi:Uncharacterised protein [Mycobacteroides abscessus]|nr:Uncharacterised protein [Mycobacteroides abscessus]
MPITVATCTVWPSAGIAASRTSEPTSWPATEARPSRSRPRPRTSSAMSAMDSRPSGPPRYIHHSLGSWKSTPPTAARTR